MRLSEYDCVPECMTFWLLGDYFSLKRPFSSGQFSLFFLFFLHFWKEFQKNWWYFLWHFISSPLHFLPAVSQLVCFPATFELCHWQFMSYVLQLAASFFSPLCLLGATHSPSCCEADRWTGGQKMEAYQSPPVLWAVFKSSGNQIDLSALNACVCVSVCAL